MALHLNWGRCGDDSHWCDLKNLNLDSLADVIGVYIIWHEGSPGMVVRLGQGKIKTRLSAHRNDPEVMAYAAKGTLRVTWAEVPAHQLDGVERYLANTWSPLVGDAFPVATPIAVNSPFAA